MDLTSCFRASLRWLLLLAWPVALHAQPTVGTVDFDVVDLRDKEQATIALSDDSTIVLLKDYVSDGGPGEYTWVGSVQDDPNGRAFITVSASTAFGTVNTSNGYYRLALPADSAAPVEQIERASFPPLAEPLQPIFSHGFETGPFALPALVRAATCDDTPERIDVMVLFSDDAAAAAPGIHKEITLAMQQTRDIVEYSNIEPGVQDGIALGFNVVHSQEVPVDESRTIPSEDLVRNFQQNRVVKNVYELRDRYAADVVFLIVESLGDACGIAYLGPSEGEAFAVVRRSCLGYEYTFTHELAHLFGAQHDKYAIRKGITPLPFLSGTNYGYSYLGPTSGWRTIMAYEDECKDFGISPCPVRNFLSSPHFALGGTPTGELDTDNRRQLIKAAPAVACFRDRTAPKLALNVSKVWYGGVSDSAPETAGTVVSQPAGISCDPVCSAEFESGQTITLTASPREGWRFAAWGSPGPCAGSRNPQCSFPLQTEQTAKALFSSTAAPGTKLLDYQLHCQPSGLCAPLGAPDAATIEFGGTTGDMTWEGSFDRRMGQSTIEVSGSMTGGDVDPAGSGPTFALNYSGSVLVLSPTLPNGTPVSVRVSVTADHAATVSAALQREDGYAQGQVSQLRVSTMLPSGTLEVGLPYQPITGSGTYTAGGSPEQIIQTEVGGAISLHYYHVAEAHFLVRGGTLNFAIDSRVTGPSFVELGGQDVDFLIQ
jgi:hypothetical protein